MSFSFKPARRENVHVIVGLAGGTGSGKTYSAMRLATGLSNGKRFAVIDTEAGRAKHYADAFAFDHGDLGPPFSPDRYLEAILAAEKAGYPVIVVDSMSHEHAGEGGLLDMHEAEFQRMGARDAVKMTAWIKPKMAHKKMVQRIMQLRSHLVFCFRAEPKMKIVKNAKGKMEPIDDGWHPICAKVLEIEMVVSHLLMHDMPGIPTPIKLPESIKPAFPMGRHITEESGLSLLAWANGGAPGDAAAVPTMLDEANEIIDAAHTIDELRTAYRLVEQMDLEPTDKEAALERCSALAKARGIK
jgi:hypothetical protein